MNGLSRRELLKSSSILPFWNLHKQNNESLRAGTSAISTPPQGWDWTSYQFDSRNIGQTGTDNVLSNPTIQWQAQTRTAFSPILIAGSFGYVVGVDEIRCINLNTEQEEWQKSITRSENTTITHGPAIDGRYIYAAGEEGLQKLDRFTGERQWFAGSEDNRVALTSKDAVTVGSESIYLGTGEAVVAVNKESGSVRWRHEIERGIGTGTRGMFAPAIYQNRIIGSFSDGKVISFNSNGDIEWETQVGTGWTDSGNEGPEPIIIGGPSVIQDQIHIPTIGESSGGIYALDPESGDSNQLSSVDCSNGIATGLNRLFVSNYDRGIVGIDQDDGTIDWEYSGSADEYGTPVLASDMIYVMGSDGYLYAINASVGEERWTLRTDYDNLFPPSPADQFILAPSNGGIAGIISEEYPPSYPTSTPTETPQTQPPGSTSSTTDNQATTSSETDSVGSSPTTTPAGGSGPLGGSGETSLATLVAYVVGIAMSAIAVAFAFWIAFKDYMTSDSSSRS